MTCIPLGLIKQNFYSTIFPYFFPLHSSPSSWYCVLFSFYNYCLSTARHGSLTPSHSYSIILFSCSLTFLFKMLLSKLQGKTQKSTVHNICQEKVACPSLSSPKIFAFRLKYPVDILMSSDNVPVLALDMTNGKKF